ncbi:hypothetical protein [Rhodoflexus sp.]
MSTQLVYCGQLVRCYVEPLLKILYCEWFKVDMLPSEQLICDEVQQCLDLLASTGYGKVLDNSVQVNYPIVPEVQVWVAAQLQQMANKGLLQRYAIVMPQDLIAELSNEQIIEEANQMQEDEALFEMRNFFSDKEALEWLVS